jgi:UDP-N-acetylglucosamine 2-epimerase (non-hydrolysing)
MKLLNVCGARPNFMKIAPLMEAVKDFPRITPLLVHTGQHYDANMSTLFFDELGIPKPDVNLEVGSASHAQQTAQIMARFEPVLLESRPDAVLVVGDVNSTIACGLVACKLDVPVIHVEAGLRSFDDTMPEEINRRLTDALSDLLLVSEPSGQANLAREGINGDRVHLVGNVMIDTLKAHLDRARRCDVLQRLELQPRRYAVLTLHRPGNVDDPGVLSGIITALEVIQRDLDVVFCVHPRTRQRAAACGLLARMEALPRLRLTDPLGYLEFLALMDSARIILTDSGGMQEEATILRVPCLTLRTNTERPITLTHGTNLLAGNDAPGILQAYSRLPEIERRPACVPPLWDGQAARRIAKIINDKY